MKILYKNLLDGTNLTVNKADAEFPLENVLDSYPQNIWKSTDNTAKFTFQASRYESWYACALYLWHKYISSLKFTFKDGETTVFEKTETITYDSLSKSSWIGLDFCDRELLANRLEIEAESENSGIELECGIMRLGTLQSFRAPELSANHKDNSIVKSLVSGSRYVKKRRGQRVFNVSFRDDIQQQYINAGMPLFYDVWDSFGPSPVPIMLLEPDDYKMIIFGSIGDVSYDYTQRTITRVNFTLTEQI